MTDIKPASATEFKRFMDNRDNYNRFISKQRDSVFTYSEETSKKDFYSNLGQFSKDYIDIYDTNKDGRISLNEFKTVEKADYKKMFPEDNNDLTYLMFQMMCSQNLDFNGNLMSMLLNAYTSKKKKEIEMDNKIDLIFQNLDTDDANDNESSKGYLDAKEISAYIALMDTQDGVVDKSGKNLDGKIKYSNMLKVGSALENPSIRATLKMFKETIAADSK